MNNEEKNKIINSLQTIHNLCSYKQEQESCKECPFEISGSCGIIDTYPCNWKIFEPKKWQVLSK